MRNHQNDLQGTIDFCEDFATVRAVGRPPVVAKVLGSETSDREERIYLDRLIHDRHHTKVCGFEVDGCYTTILINRSTQ